MAILRIGSADISDTTPEAPFRRASFPEFPDEPRIAMSRSTVLLALAALIVVGAGAWGALGLRRSHEIPFAGAQMIRLTSSGHASKPIPSPDGAQLAYTEERCGNGICHSDLMIRDMNGVGSAAIVAEPNTAAIPLSWSPDGRWVLFGVLDIEKQEVIGLRIVSQRGGAPRLVAESATSAAFVSNDTLIVLSKSGPSYWLRRQVVPTGNIVDSVPLPFAATVYGVSASTSGRWLMARAMIGKDTVRSVILDRAGRPTDTTTVSYQWDLSARDALLTTRATDATGGWATPALIRRRISAKGRLAAEDTLATLTSHDDFQTISADATQIFFEQTHPGETTRWTASRRDTKSEFQVGRLLVTGSKPADKQLSPRGGWIVTPPRSQNGTSTQGIAVEPFNGGQRVLLDPALTSYVDLAFSPRDDSVAIATSDGNDRLVITLYPLPSGRPVRISSLTGSVVDLEWLSDGRLVSPAEDRRSIRVFGRAGETSHIPFPDSLGSISSISRSPVAAELALLSQSRETHNNRSLFLSRMDMSSGKVTLITRVPTYNGSVSQLWWSSDGNLRFVIHNPLARSGTLMRVPVAGGEISQEPPLTFALNSAVDFLSHDGLRAVVTSLSYTTDIWVMRASGTRK